ncbi:hypothetical protein DPMN_117212 [Dreissena polymorpha]|uniref:Uncharacterized protein n=1 Tax=Dreissena polymorpha TaxID=45954 RepID=A0A9D4KQ29_DREPO|nr:hypothetical protein DPMN_117212 [Dreissena polymorpha]
MGHSMSLISIRNVRHDATLHRMTTPGGATNSTSSRRPYKVTPDFVCTIRRWISKINPPTQRKIALDTGMSKGTVYNIIKNVLKAKLRKTCKVHQLNMAQIQKRRTRHWELYLKLKCCNWRDFVTSYEAMFYLGGNYGRRRVCYVRMGENVGDKLEFVKRDAFARGFMAWAAVSSRCRSEIKEF